jgi:glycine/D-amino acid oxidase-like deaminating enzyme
MARESNLWRDTGGAEIAAPALSGAATADVAIIGGGYTGCSAALHLAEAGAKVCLLEAQSVGHGGSGRNVGLVNAGLWTPPDEVEAILGRGAGAKLNNTLAAAPEEVFKLVERFGIPCEATRKGTLHCAHSNAGLKDLRRRHAQQLARKAPVELLDVAETVRRTGTKRFHGALFDRRAGTIQPLAYVRGLARAAIEAGAKLYESSPVTGARHDGSAWQVTTLSGRVVAKTLIQATNGYEIRDAQRPAYTPVHFFQCATRPLRDDQRGKILAGGEGCWDTATVMTSFRLDAAGRLLLGAVGNLDGFGKHCHLGWARRMLGRLYPDLSGQEFEQAWCGRIAMTADHLPKVEAIGLNAIRIYGYSGRGIGPGTVFGRAAADWAVSGEEDVLPVPLREKCQEHFTDLKGLYYECGSSLMHLLVARFTKT